MTTLAQPQVDAFRLRAHHLHTPAAGDKLYDVVTQLGGIHAQVMSAAEQALWARIRGVGPEDVRGALWEKRSLVKTWAMRGTLHLFSADDFPIVVAALRSKTGHRRESWLRYFETSLEELEALTEAVREALDGQCLTREELASAVARATGNSKFEERLCSGWGTFLKPAAYMGYLCFGPSRGQSVTFVRPDQWLGGWREEDPGEAMKEMARRFFTAYGPATRDEFARWWGVQPADVRPVLTSMGDELEEVRVDGSKAHALRSTLKSLSEQRESNAVRLLGMFDPYTVGAYSARSHLTKEQKARVSRTGAWLWSVVLVGGRIMGVWDPKKARKRLEVSVEMFSPLSKAVKEGIEAEAQRLGEYAGAQVEVSIV